MIAPRFATRARRLHPLGCRCDFCRRLAPPAVARRPFVAPRPVAAAPARLDPLSWRERLILCGAGIASGCALASIIHRLTGHADWFGWLIG